MPKEDVVGEYINKRQHTVRKIKGFFKYFLFRLRSLVVWYDNEVCWMWERETEGKRSGCVGRVLYR